MSATLFSGGSAVVISDQLSKLEWFLLDFLEGFIRLPVRLIERRQCGDDVRTLLESYSWKALIINISEARMDSRGFGSSQVDNWLNWVASLMGDRIRSEDFKEFDKFISTLSRRTDALSKLIVEKLGSELKDAVEDWQRISPSKKNELKPVMLFRLNTFIQENDLREYAGNPDKSRHGSRRQRSVRKKSTGFYSGGDLRAKNIKLLTNSYKGFFHKRPRPSNKKIYLLISLAQKQDIHQLRELGFSEDRCFVTGQEDTHFKIASLLWRDLKRAPKLVKTNVSERIRHKVLRSIFESSELEFEDTQRIATTLNSGDLVQSNGFFDFELRDVDPDSIRDQHYIAVVADSALKPRETESITPRLIRKVLSQVGRSPVGLRTDQTRKASWLLCDQDIAIFFNSSTGQPISLPPSKSLSTRRYLVQIDGDSPISPTVPTKTVLPWDIRPVAHWGAEVYISSALTANTNLGRSNDVLGYQSIESVKRHSYPIVQLLLRDFKTIKREYSVWRRIGAWVDVIPRSFDEARRYIMIAPLEKELQEILNHPKIGYWESLALSPLHRDMLYEAFIIDESGELQPCLVGCINIAGRLPAGLFAYRQIARWQPSYILLYGIAGSLTDEENPPQKGDLVVAQRIVDYEYGKVSGGKFESRPQTYTCSLSGEASAYLRSFDLGRYGEGWPFDGDESIRSWVRSVIREATQCFISEAKTLIPEKIRNELNLPPKARKAERENRLKTLLNKRKPFGQIISGTVATGDKVVADNRFRHELVNKILRSHSHGLKAVEMEGAGIAAAIECFPDGVRPGFVMIRGICDDATPNKNDLWQPIAAKMSAAATIEFFLCHKKNR
jgi:nucleoside phosphorylase